MPPIDPSDEGLAKGRTRGQIIRLVLAVLVVQVVYWMGIIPLTRAPAAPAPDSVRFADIEIAELGAPELQAVDSATFTPVTLPHTVCCDPVYLALRLRFELGDIPADGLGIITNNSVDNFRLFANGSLIAGEGRMELGKQTFHGGRRTLQRIPSGLLNDGDNELLFITSRGAIPYSDFYAPIVGPYDAIRDWASRRLWFLNVYPQLASLCTSIVAVLALIVWMRSEEKSYLMWMVLLSSAWSMSSIYSLVMVDPPGGALTRHTYYFAVTNFLPVALFGLVDSWSNFPSRIARRALVLAWVAVVGYCIVRIHLTPAPDGFDAADTATSWFMIAGSVAAAARVLHNFIRARDNRTTEMAILSLVVAATTMDALSELTKHFRVGNVSEAAPFLLVAMTAAFLNRNFHLFQSASAINEMLSARLKDREVELAASHARESEHVRERALLSERQRILRDMHDGLGSQLMSLLTAARRERLSHAGMAEGVQAVIDEMRLMIHSMDSVGESLPSALRTLRERTETRLSGTGIEIIWNNNVTAGYPELQPRQILHLFRIIQEAVANALKHSDSDVIVVSVDTIDPHGGIAIRVRDNGVGILGEPGRGAGLANMRRRAEEIGGTLRIGAASPGTEVLLTIPGAADAAQKCSGARRSKSEAG